MKRGWSHGAPCADYHRPLHTNKSVCSGVRHILLGMSLTGIETSSVMSPALDWATMASEDASWDASDSGGLKTLLTPTNRHYNEEWWSRVPFRVIPGHFSVVNRVTLRACRYVDDFLRPVVLPLILHNTEFTFHQHNACLHMAIVATTCFRARTILPWPARLPDLSLIDNVWGTMDCIIGASSFFFFFGLRVYIVTYIIILSKTINFTKKEKSSPENIIVYYILIIFFFFL